MSDKSKDTKHAKYRKFIHGDPDTLKRISLLYYDEVCRNKYYPDGIFIDGSLLIRTDMETWNSMVKNLGLKRYYISDQKRHWEID